ncbi:MAG: DMT family transporter [Peptococcaceae bacterium]|nr:DMT family transporter [Peptococcaceae bacterium]
MKTEQTKQYKADLALLFVSFIWGITFVVVKDALHDIEPFYFLGYRFAGAFLFLGLIFHKALFKINIREVAAGALIGVFLFGGYAFQTVGLKYTGAANAGFITGLALVLVPLFVTIISRKLPSAYIVTGVLVSFLGLAMLSLGNNFILNYGDILVFFCAICYAIQIMMVGKYAVKLDPVKITLVQIGTVSVISFILAFFLETPPQSFTRPVWMALLATSVPATSLAFLIQNKAQKFTSPIHTAIIFTTEPVFAGFAAFVLAGEILSGMQLFGCALILTGMLIADLKGLINNRLKEEPIIGS